MPFFFFFFVQLGAKNRLFWEKIIIVLARKNKISPMYEFKVSPLSLFLSLFFFENSLVWDKKREKNTKGERRKARNERGRYRVLFLTYLIAVKRLSARRLALVSFFNQNYRRQRWNRERYVVDVINIISSRYFHATQSFRVVTYRALRRVQL